MNDQELEESSVTMNKEKVQRAVLNTTLRFQNEHFTVLETQAFIACIRGLLDHQIEKVKKEKK